MRLLSVTLDRNLLNPSSPVVGRQISYFHGWDVDLVVLAGGHARTVELAPGIRAYAVEGTRKARIFWNAFRLAARLARDHAVDLVTAQDIGWTGFLAWVVACDTGARLVLQDHSARFSRPTHFLARFLARRADRVRTVSERGRKGLHAIGVAHDRIDVIPIATDLSRFHDVLPADVNRHNVLCIARLEPEKGVDVLLRVWPAVFAQFVDARLRIVGDGRERYRLELLARDLNLAEVVEFVGQHADVRPDLEWANVVVQPSRFEGWGLAIIEAAAAGRPVVMTAVGCAEEVIVDRESGRVVPTEDTIALGEALTDILLHPGNAARYAAAARERVSHLPSTQDTATKIRESMQRALVRAR